MKLVTIANSQWKEFAFEVPGRAVLIVRADCRGFLPPRVRTIAEGIDAGKSGQVELSDAEIAGIVAVDAKVAELERVHRMVSRPYSGSGKW